MNMPWQSVGDAVDFLKEGGKSILSSRGYATAGYRGLSTEMMDDDDFGLGDDDDEAPVLGDSLAEYANLPAASPALGRVEVGIDLINLDDGDGVMQQGRGSVNVKAVPKALPSAPVPKLEGPPK